MAKPSETGAPVDPQTKNDKDIAAGYAGAIAAAEKAEQAAADLKRDLKEQAEGVAASAEERRRFQDKALYDMAVERQKVLDGYAREDAEREQKFEERDAELGEREDLLAELLALPEGAEVSAKDLRAAFEKRITDARAEGDKAGSDRQAAAYGIQKKLDAAEAEKTNALLRQENEQLKKANADLVRSNGELLANQQKVVGDMKDVAQGAFTAAGGVMAAGTNAMTSAAGAGQQRRPGQ